MPMNHTKYPFNFSGVSRDAKVTRVPSEDSFIFKTSSTQSNLIGTCACLVSILNFKSYHIPLKI